MSEDEVTIDCFGMTDQGKTRKKNEDQFLYAKLGKSMLIEQTSLKDRDPFRILGNTKGHLSVVADGVGGNKAGERASGLAVEALCKYVLNTMPWFFRLSSGEEQDLKEDLLAAVEGAQERIDLEADESLERKGMATTLTLSYVLWPRMYVVHVGDSRCYLLRNGKLNRITTDHTMATRLVDHGAMTEEQAENSPLSHTLWNVVGGSSEELSPEIHKMTLEPGDRILLCTDGLTKHVSDEDIRNTLSEERSAEEICSSLIRSANAGGGSDNITVFVGCFS